MKGYKTRRVDRPALVVRDKLRDGVKKALDLLANGFLRHPNNSDLFEKLAQGNAPQNRTLPAGQFYSDLLQVIYRFLFLLVSEDRGLISTNKTYLDHYSVIRLRGRALRHEQADERHEDLWHGFRVLWKLLADDTARPQANHQPAASLLGLPVLNGRLFESTCFDSCCLYNADFLQAMKSLLYYEDQGTLRLVNYAALDVEELGSVYESLLDYQPVLIREGAGWRFRLSPGSERKQTGSYYTPRELVAALLDETLTPVIRERLKANPQDRQEALLSIRVLDPSCGSGHFLLAAARRIATELARVRTGEDEPSPEPFRQACRDVIARCVYGVDLNPLAVELCRAALWVESQTPGVPLTFLNHRIRCGNSLVGVLDLDHVNAGIPNSAFQGLKKHSQHLAAIRRLNNTALKDLQDRRGLLFIDADFTHHQHERAEPMEALSRLPDDSPETVRKKQQAFDRLQQLADPDRTLCNLWTAAFFQGFADPFDSETAITSLTLRGWLEHQRVTPQAVAVASALAEKLRFFHWPIEFPEIFEQGGFDVVVGNPPWERLEKQPPPKNKAPEADGQDDGPGLDQGDGAGNAAQDPAEADTRAALSHYFRNSGAYPLTGQGILNTYSLFTERARALAGSRGWMGLLVPTGIASDLSNHQCFADLLHSGRLEAFLDFENRKRLFPEVNCRFRFSLLVLRPKETARPEQLARFMFCLIGVDQIKDPYRRIRLTPEDFSRLNPDTASCPLFRTAQDARLTLDLYRRLPMLEGGRKSPGPWHARFLTLFQMGGPSMKRAEALQRQGLQREGNRFAGAGTDFLPVYEGKLFNQYNHRHATYAASGGKNACKVLGENNLRNPAFFIQPQYWVDAGELEARLVDWPRSWLLAWRDITNAANARTVICAVLPRCPASHKAHVLCTPEPAPRAAALLAWLNSLTLDYLARQKISGAHLTHGHMRQLPAPPPADFTDPVLAFVAPRVVALTFTAWDVADFAADVWNEGSAEVREILQKMRLDWGDWDGRPVTWQGKQYPLPPFPWEPSWRAEAQAQLDAWFARMCHLNRKQLRYLLDPADLTPAELRDLADPEEEVKDPLDPAGYKARREASTFEGETFRALRERELRQYGEYRTRRMVLEAWENLQWPQT